jgi:hypothetical protein
VPYAGLVAVVFAAYVPLWRGFPHAAWADSGDGSAFLWNYWRFPDALLHGDNPVTEQLLFHPVGAHTAFNTNTPLVSILSWPLQQLFGLAGASVVVGLAALVLSAIAAYLLTLRVGGSRPAAFFAGVAFALLPWRTTRIVTHLNLIHTEWPAFALVAALALLEHRTRARAVVLGAVGAGALLTDFNTGVMAAMAVVILLVVRWREASSSELRGKLALAAGAALVLSLPLLVPLALDAASGEAASPPGLQGAQAYSTDVLSWVLPLPGHPWWGSRFEESWNTTTGQERFAYVGPIVVALAVLGAWSARSSRRVWLAIVAVFGVLAFGPALHVNGWTGHRFSYDGFAFSVPLPYLLLHAFVPGFSAFRAPDRFASVATLALIVLAALGLDRAAGAARRRATTRPSAAGAAVFAVASALVVIDFLPPTSYPLLDTTVDPAYGRMAADDAPGAVLDLPLSIRTGLGAIGDGTGSDQSRFMYTATFHRRPMVGGSVSRLPDARLRALQEIHAYHDILRVQGAYGPSTDPPTFTGDELASLGIRFVVVHHDSANPVLRDYVATLGLLRFAESPALTVWRVPGEG